MKLDTEIKDGMGLVRFVLKQYYPMHLYDDDYIQEGMIGLWKALKRFDSSRGVRFSTFAVICILGEVRSYIRREMRRPTTYSLDFPITEEGDYTLGDTLYSDCDMFEDRLLNKIDTERDLLHLKNQIDDIGRNILYLKIEDKSQREIAEELGVSRTKVFNEIKSIKEKYSWIRELNKNPMALASSE